MENRPNAYSFPHKAIRNALGKLSLKAGALNVNHPEEIDELVALTEEVSELLSHHLHAEEDVVLPQLEARVPGSTQSNREEHIEMERLEHEMVDKAHQLKANPNLFTANELYDQVNLFVREYFGHMHDEETRINQLIWDNFEDAEILEWHGQILSGFTPEVMFKWFKYMIPSLFPEEQSVLLGAFKQNAPPQAYVATLEGLKPYLAQSQIVHVSSI